MVTKNLGEFLNVAYTVGNNRDVSKPLEFGLTDGEGARIITKTFSVPAEDEVEVMLPWEVQWPVGTYTFKTALLSGSTSLAEDNIEITIRRFPIHISTDPKFEVGDWVKYSSVGRTVPAVVVQRWWDESVWSETSKWRYNIIHVGRTEMAHMTAQVDPPTCRVVPRNAGNPVYHLTSGDFVHHPGGPAVLIQEGTFQTWSGAPVTGVWVGVHEPRNNLYETWLSPAGTPAWVNFVDCR